MLNTNFTVRSPDLDSWSNNVYPLSILSPASREMWSRISHTPRRPAPHTHTPWDPDRESSPVYVPLPSQSPRHLWAVTVRAERTIVVQGRLDPHRYERWGKRCGREQQEQVLSYARQEPYFTRQTFHWTCLTKVQCSSRPDKRNSCTVLSSNRLVNRATSG